MKKKLIPLLSLGFLIQVIFAGCTYSDDYDIERRQVKSHSPLYQEECGSCHFSYPSNLLPKESWSKMMADLENHFGEDASLEEGDQQKILLYLTQNSRSYNASRKTKRMYQDSSGQLPTKITETRYFRGEHDELSASVFRRKSIRTPANCTACHTTAKQGDFDEDNVKIPRR